MGIIGSFVADVVHDAAKDMAKGAAIGGALAALEAPGKFRDKHPKKAKGAKKSQIVLTPFSSEEFKGRQVLDVKSVLEQKGFKNIILIPKRDLVIGLMTKDGDIESVTINGRTEFGAQAKFYENDAVDIVFHTFK